MPILGQKMQQQTNSPPSGGILRRLVITDPQLREQAQMEQFHQQNVPSFEQKVADTEQSDFAQMNQAQQDYGRMFAQQNADEQTMIDQRQMEEQQQAFADMPKLEPAGNARQDSGNSYVNSFLTAMDTIARDPVVKKVGEVGRSLYTPGAGAANVASYATGVGAGIGKLLPRLGGSLAGIAATGAIQGAAVEAPIAVGQALASQTNQLDEAAVQGAIGGGMGGILGGSAPFVGKAVRSGLDRLRASKNVTIEPRREPSVQDENVAKVTRSEEMVTQLRDEKNAYVSGLVEKYGGNWSSKANPEEDAKFMELHKKWINARDKLNDVTDQVQAEPMKQNWFTSLFGDKGIGISAVSTAKKQRVGPLTTSDQIVQSPLRRDIEGIKSEVGAAARATYQNYVDSNSPLKKISKDVYDRSIDANRANNIANTIVSDKFVTPEGRVIGPGLEETFNKVARGQSKKFVDYLINRHALTRMSRMERVYADNLNENVFSVQKRIDDFEKRYPGFKELAKEWDQYNDNMLKTYGVEEGLLTPENYAMLRKKNPNYAPMRRQFTTSEKFASPFSMGAKPAFSGQKAPIKEVSPTGSVRNIVDPRRSTIEATGAWVNAAMRNRVMQGIVEKVKSNPEALKGIVEIVQPPKGQSNLNKVLADDGQEGFLEALNDEFNKLFSRTRLDEDNIVRAMVKGQPVHIKVHDPEAVKALLGMGSEQSNLVLDIFGALSNATKQGATGALAPMFAIKGLTMDTVQAMMQSQAPLRHVADLGHAIISSIADTLPKGTPGVKKIRTLAQDFRRSGGEYSAALRGERKLKKGVSDLNRNPVLSPKSLAKGVGMAVATPYRTLHKLADISENANRMAAYRGEMRRLGDVKTPENVRQAMSAARESTTNYSRKGSKSQTLEKMIPYQNAAVQGMYRFIKQWKDHPIKTAAVVGAGVLAPKFLEYLQFSGDQDYQNLPEREKYRNLIVSKNDDGTFNKIPVPPEYYGLGAAMVDLLEYTRDNNPEAFKGSADAIVNAYTPPIVSGALQGVTQGGGLEQSGLGVINSLSGGPIIGALNNKSFSGAPIESKAVDDRSPENRYDERTSSIAKEIGKYIGLSPQKTDYLLRAYGGDPARLLLPLTSDIGRGTPRNTLLKNFIVDPVLTNNLTNDFYTGKERLTQADRDNKEVGTPLPKWFDENLYKSVTSQSKTSISKQLSSLTAAKKKINTDNALSPQEKADRLREVQRRINEIYVNINQQFEAKGVPRR